MPRLRPRRILFTEATTIEYRRSAPVPMLPNAAMPENFSALDDTLNG